MKKETRPISTCIAQLLAWFMLVCFCFFKLCVTRLPVEPGKETVLAKTTPKRLWFYKCVFVGIQHMI